MKTPRYLNGSILGAAVSFVLLSATPQTWAQRGPLGIIPDSAAAANAAAQAKNLPLPPIPSSPTAIILPLWAPDSPNLSPQAFTNPERIAYTAGVPDRIEKFYNVTNPSIEVHLVKHDPNPASDVNTGAAIILAPGGGDTELNPGTEGTDMVPYFYNLGVATIILQYSLRGTGGNPQADTLQAIRLVRAHAAEWNIDPKKIGIMGFSAGGERVGEAMVNYDAGDPTATDPVARVSSRPDFVAGIYPSGSNNGVPSNAPPSFFVVSEEDTSHASSTLTMVTNLMNAGAKNIEVHMYGYGEHGDGMKYRNGSPLGTWQNRFEAWFRDLGFLNKPGVPTKVDALSQTAPIAAPAGRGGRGGAGGRRGGGGRGAGAPAAVDGAAAPAAVPTPPAPAAQ